MASFWGGGNNLTTDSSISKQRQIAAALMNQGMDASPVGHWTQALARALQGGLGGYQMSQADAADAKLTRQRELEAATEKAKAEAEKRNTPDWQVVAGQGIYNMNPHMNPTPLMVSQFAQKSDEMTAWQRAQLERQQKLDAWRMSQQGGAKEGTDDREAAKIAKEYVTAGDSASDALGVVEELDKISNAPSLERAIGPLQGNSTLQTIGDNVPVVGGMMSNAGGNAQIKNLTAKLEAQMGRVLNKGLGPQSDADAQRVKDAVGKLPYARTRAEFKMLVSNIKKDLAKIAARGNVARKRYPQYDFTNTFEQAPTLDGPALAPASDIKSKYGLE